MLPKNTEIFASFHKAEESLVLPILEQLRTAGWQNININAETQTNKADTLETIQQSGIILIFISKNFTQNERLMLENFAYAATVARKPFIPCWLDNLADIQHFQDIDEQLLSA
ncbi:MAG: toll/interleukin-1 receptor domain-containing protein [Firmicutes bacterium]|nr:toll/interleukin-1 receptor domain-containing protein [Bacillota bacterium]